MSSRLLDSVMEDLMITTTIPLGCEVDPSLRELSRRFDDDLDIIRIVLAKRFSAPDMTFNFMHENAHPSACWILYLRRDLISLPKAKQARFVIGEAMGLLPAFSYEFLPEYDATQAVLHKHSFVVNCKYGRTKCVRPSHLVLCTTDGHRVHTLNS